MAAASALFDPDYSPAAAIAKRVESGGVSISLAVALIDATAMQFDRLRASINAEDAALQELKLKYQHEIARITAIGDGKRARAKPNA